MRNIVETNNRGANLPHPELKTAIVDPSAGAANR